MTLYMTFRASNGQYMCAEQGGGSIVVANRNAVGPWERFEQVDAGGGRFAFKTASGHYLCAEDTGAFVANRVDLGPWEKFAVVDLGNGRVALMSHHSKYVCAENGGGGAVVADRDAIGTWEVFERGAASATSNDTIFDLTPGQDRKSGSGNVMLAMQGDGNLVLYVKRAGTLPSSGGGWVARWSSNTAGREVAFCSMQGDGNLVLYAPDNSPVWNSGTYGHYGANLEVQDDENVVIYDHGTPIWSTDTWIGGVVRSTFSPATNGFNFINSFGDGYWQFGPLTFNTQGLCGGMSFTALDYFFSGRPVPPQTNTPSATTDPLGAYINSRQQQSVIDNLGGWTTQILNPDANALRYWSTHDEWNKLTAAIDSGNPVPIGMGIYLNGSSSHQIVATGYQSGKQEKWILAYNPNQPNREAWVHLAPGSNDWYDSEGRTYRGFFVSAYAIQNAP